MNFKMPENLYEKFKDLQIAILGICLAIGIIFAVVVSTTNLSKDNISVTGSAYEIVKSDEGRWGCSKCALFDEHMDLNKNDEDNND